MVTGMVLIKIPNELAWSLYFDMSDVLDLRAFHCLLTPKF